jgi:hypothetical protein
MAAAVPVPMAAYHASMEENRIRNPSMTRTPRVASGADLDDWRLTGCLPNPVIDI